jgi:hypothetical protein
MASSSWLARAPRAFFPLAAVSLLVAPALGGCSAEVTDLEPSAVEAAEETEDADLIASLGSEQRTGSGCWLQGLAVGAAGAAVTAWVTTGGCAGATLVTTAGTGTPLCLAPAAAATAATITGILAGGAANLICNGQSSRVTRSTGGGSTLRWTEQDYTRQGITQESARKLAAAQRCSPAEYLRRAAQVHGPNSKCDRLQACQNPPRNQPDGAICNLNRQRLDAYRQCVAARQQRDYCFGGADQHHQDTVNRQLTNAMSTCTDAIRRSCR